MEADGFEIVDIFRAVAHGQVRALLIGRQALVLLGLPVHTADIDFWLHADDVEGLDRALAPLGLFPTRTPEEARASGRYALENDERVDVLVARAVTSPSGERVAFDEVWVRSQVLELGPGVTVRLPCLDDLIRTKRFGGRPRDAEDIRLLERLRARGRT